MAIYLTPDSVRNMNGVTVKTKLLSKDNPNKLQMPAVRSKPLGGITVHNTDRVNVNPATTNSEQYARAQRNGALGQVRVQYYVCDTEAWQTLEENSENWSCADGRGDGNTTTIAIECIMDGTNNEYNIKARDNCARLVAQLLYENNLPITKVFTHTHWLNVRDGKTGTTEYLNTLKHPYKWCPYYILSLGWSQFMTLVEQYLTLLRMTKGTTAGISAVVNNAQSAIQAQSKTQPTTVAPTKTYKVQVGSFSIKAYATLYQTKAIKAGFTGAYVTEATVGGRTVYRVQIGAFKLFDNAEAYKKKAIEKGFTNAYII
jgi:N-acetylmuramoyl-L-alanine amidase CwlA